MYKFKRNNFKINTFTTLQVRLGTTIDISCFHHWLHALAHAKGLRPDIELQTDKTLTERASACRQIAHAKVASTTRCDVYAAARNRAPSFASMSTSRTPTQSRAGLHFQSSRDEMQSRAQASTSSRVAMRCFEIEGG
jgi:hypothetical protein